MFLYGPHLGGEHREHRIAGAQDLSIAAEGQVGTGQDDAGLYDLGKHIRARLFRDLEQNHPTIHDHGVAHLCPSPRHLHAEDKGTTGLTDTETAVLLESGA